MLTKPYFVEGREDEYNRVTFSVTKIAEPPDCLALIMGDVLQNLKSALDHLAYQIVLSGTDDKPQNVKSIYFPIADTMAKYDEQKKKQFLGASAEAFAALDGIKPYKEGNKLLWCLHQLNIIEKHRLLFTVGSFFKGLDICPLLQANWDKSGLSQVNWAETTQGIVLAPQDANIPLFVGQKLFTGAPNDYTVPTFMFRVAVFEEAIAPPQPMIEMAKQMVVLVAGILGTLTPYLKAAT